MPLIWRSQILHGLNISITGATKPDIVVLISCCIVQIESERTSIRSIIPITAAEERALRLYDFPFIVTIPLSSKLVAFEQSHSFFLHQMHIV